MNGSPLLVGGEDQLWLLREVRLVTKHHPNGRLEKIPSNSVRVVSQPLSLKYFLLIIHKITLFHTSASAHRPTLWFTKDSKWLLHYWVWLDQPIALQILMTLNTFWVSGLSAQTEHGTIWNTATDVHKHSHRHREHWQSELHTKLLWTNWQPNTVFFFLGSDSRAQHWDWWF